jgi:hypothetical protein
MIETRPIVWKSPPFTRSFPCFIKGCGKLAGHVSRFRHGDAIVQVCLCNECLLKSPESILQGLTKESKHVLH